jgi:GH24 family phage-related lysozyme (muramidase)
MKRLLCAALAALIPLSVIPVSVLAVETMTTSEDCIQILKDMEGFVKMPIYDNGQYTVGYGSSCNPKDYPNGITEKEADALLREFLATMEADLNKFASRYNLKFSQNQFDALMLFTYNCGSNWVRSEGEFRSAVIEGKTGNDFIYAITLWSSASSKLHLGLVERRLIEADMYLNGSYTNKKPAAYTYVQFDNNGGVSDVRVQGYNSAETVQPKPVPSLTGARFLGWYTEKEGGSWVTYLTADTAKDTLYAHWQTGNGDAANGTSASYQRSTAQMTSENIYNAPGGTVTGKLAAGSTVSIVADYVDGSNVKWGKLSQGGWVNLGNPLVGTGSEPESVTVTVINDAINVRSGAGTNHPEVGTVFKGEKLVITETKLVGSDL